MDDRRRPDLLIRQVQNGWVVAERNVVDGCWSERGGREHVATSAHALAALVLQLTAGADAKPPEPAGFSVMPCSGHGYDTMLAGVRLQAASLPVGSGHIG